jgi:hypothetical protein
MGEIFSKIQSDPICAKDIVISEHRPLLFVSEQDDVFCYTGVCLNSGSVSLDTCPYYFKGKHSTHIRVKTTTKGFFRISQGCILLDNFIDANAYSSGGKYKKCDCFLKLPTGSITSYGVFKNCDTEEVALTRAVFGLTYNELYELLKGYAKTLGIYNDYMQYPRITRYQRHDNFCDFCGLWIPKQFPYVTFSESGHDFSHVSLWTCYRYLQLIIRNRIDSSVANLLIDNGVSKNILERLLCLNEYKLRSSSYDAQIVTQDMLRGCEK